MTNTGRAVSFVMVSLWCQSCSAAPQTLNRERPEQVAVGDENALGFRPIRIGGGGFVVDMDISPDGQTKITRTDVHGAYIWNASAREWEQLVTPTSLPPGDPLVRSGVAIGVYAIRVAPSDSKRLYMVAPALSGLPSTLYRSDDRGAHWLKTSLKPVEMSVQSAGRVMGPKMAVSPTDPDFVIIGDTAGRIHITHDGGKSWTDLPESQVPKGADPSIAFVSTSGGAGSADIFISTGKNGVFRSVDGGTIWRKTEGGPSSITRISSAPGALYVTDADDNSLKNAWRWSGGQWTRLDIASPSQGNYWHAIAISPKDPKLVVMGTTAGNITASRDGGKTWTGYFNDAPQRVARDVPWLAWTQESWMSNGNMLFDPSAPDKLYFAQGIGVWYTSAPRDDTKPTWTSQTRGIEELIANDLIVPPGGKPIVAVQDRGVFRIENPERYPETHGPDRDAPIRHAWALDYVAQDPKIIVMIANAGASDRSGISTDGGKTWTDFASKTPVSPPGQVGGAIAAASARNIVWAPSNNGRAFYTKDGGKTWNQAQFPAPLPQGESGWAFSLYQNRHVFAADRVQAGSFYAYNYGPGAAPSAAGTYRSDDGGANWRKVGSGFGIPGSMGTSAKLASVPGKAGHLFFASGTTGLGDKHPYNFPLQHSRDGGATWRALPKTEEIWAVGFGKAATGREYPTIFIAGFANGERDPGLYCSTDEGSSWQKLISYPGGNIDAIRAISGDMNAAGRVYYGFSGSGAGYGVFNQCR